MKRAIIFISALLFSFNSFSQNTNTWKISGNGLKEDSYIVGTFHMMCSEHFLIKDKVKNALAKTSRFVMEINYADPSEIAAMQKMLQSDSTISSRLTKEKAEKLDLILKDYGTNLKNVDQLSPQALYSLIGQKAIPCKQEEVRMYDIELLKSAIQQKKSIGSLEKVDEQFMFLGKAFSMDEIIEQLSMADEYSKLSAVMISAFNDENMEELEKFVTDRRFTNEEQEKWMLTERNKNWVLKSIPASLKEGSSLFAMGSAHLFGKNGVIELLRKQGYTLTPVYN